MANRIIAQSTNSASYTAMKAAAQGGSIGGVAVTLLVSHDASRRLYCETLTDADIDTLEDLVRGTSTWDVQGIHYDFTEADAFAISPLAYAAGKAAP